jgi:hypothetical protein
MDSTRIISFGISATFSLFASLISLSLLMAACGGGSSEDTTDCSGGGSQPGCFDEAQSGRYLFYSGSLAAIDPDDPGTSVKLESSDAIVSSRSGYQLAIRRFFSGSYDNSSRIVSDYVIHALIYANTNGRLYKVSAEKEDDLLTVQVSDESMADQICLQVSGTPVFDSRGMADDYANPDASQFVYSLAGEDGECDTVDDNVWKMIRLGMDSNDSPIDALPPLTALWNLDRDASVQGWLVNDSGVLKRCDEEFSHCGAGLIQVAEQARHLLDLGMNNHLLEIDAQLYVYNGAANQLSEPIYTIPQGELISSFTADQEMLFFASGFSIYRAPIDGDSEAVVIGEETWSSSEEAVVWNMSLTDNRIVYIKTQSDMVSGPEIRVLDKTGGTAETLISLDDSMQAFIAVQGEHIFYYFDQVEVSTDGVQRIVAMQAGIMDENGIENYLAYDSAWVGWVNSNSLDKGKSSSQARLRDTFILGETTNQDIGSMALMSFDASSGDELIDLGNLPDVEGVIGFNCHDGDANDLLCLATIEIASESSTATPASQQDIFYLDVSSRDTIVRVTETQYVSESLLSNH